MSRRLLLPLFRGGFVLVMMTSLHAGDLTLTGLARRHGHGYAYLVGGASGHNITLKLGEEVDGLKLESIDFKAGSVVVISGTESLTLAMERRPKESAPPINPSIAAKQPWLTAPPPPNPFGLGPPPGNHAPGGAPGAAPFKHPTHIPDSSSSAPQTLPHPGRLTAPTDTHSSAGGPPVPDPAEDPPPTDH